MARATLRDLIMLGLEKSKAQKKKRPGRKKLPKDFRPNGDPEFQRKPPLPLFGAGPYEDDEELESL